MKSEPEPLKTMYNVQIYIISICTPHFMSFVFCISREFALNLRHPGPRGEWKGGCDGHGQSPFREEKFQKLQTLPTLVNYAYKMGLAFLCAGVVIQRPMSQNPRNS